MPNKKILNLLENEYELIFDKTQTIKYNKSNNQHKIILVYYIKALEISKSIIELIKLNKGTVSSMILMRSLLELQVDFKNINNYEWYLSYLYNLSLSSDLIFMKYVEKCISKKEKNIFIEIAYKEKNEENIKNSINNFKNMLENNEKALKTEILKDEKKILNFKGHISDKFKLAGDNEVYKTIYKILCDETHNNLETSMNRFSNYNGQILAFQPVSNIEMYMIVNLVETCLYDISDIVFKYFNMNDDDKYKEKLEEIQKEIKLILTENK